MTGSVPVDLGFDPRVLHSLEDFGSSTRGGGGIKIGKIEINVSTPNSESFNASRNQIVQEMEREIRRAVRTIGSSSDIDDPTVRFGD